MTFEGTIWMMLVIFHITAQLLWAARLYKEKWAGGCGVEAEERESWGQFYFIILLKADVSYHPVCRKTELQLPTSILLGAKPNATISIVSI